MSFKTKMTWVVVAAGKDGEVVACGNKSLLPVPTSFQRVEQAAIVPMSRVRPLEDFESWFGRLAARSWPKESKDEISKHQELVIMEVARMAFNFGRGEDGGISN